MGSPGAAPPALPLCCCSAAPWGLQPLPGAGARGSGGSAVGTAPAPLCSGGNEVFLGQLLWLRCAFHTRDRSPSPFGSHHLQIPAGGSATASCELGASQEQLRCCSAAFLLATAPGPVPGHEVPIMPLGRGAGAVQQRSLWSTSSRLRAGAGDAQLHLNRSTAPVLGLSHLSRASLPPPCCCLVLRQEKSIFPVKVGPVPPGLPLQNAALASI